MPVFKDVLHSSRRRHEYQEGKGHKAVCGEEGDYPPELQGRPLPKDVVQARDAEIQNRETRDLHTASQQDFDFALRFETMDRGRRCVNEGLRQQEHTKSQRRA